MDIPVLAIALGIIGVSALVEYISDKFKNNSRTRPSNESKEPFSHSMLVNNENMIKSNNKNIWEADILGKTVTPGSSWDLKRRAVLKRDNYTCTNCGLRTNLTVDHKVPLSLGGSNDMNNLTTLCKDCHEHKDQREIFGAPFDARDNYGSDYSLTTKVSILATTINIGSRITIKYTDYKGNKTTRTISPKRLVKDKGRIYCISFCHLRNNKRTFRISRIEL